MNAASSARIPITDEVLKLSVGIRLEAGVDEAQIRALIDQFASELCRGEQPQDIVGFLTVEDVPQDRRAEFLQAVDGLASVGRVNVRRLLSVVDVWPSRVR